MKKGTMKIEEQQALDNLVESWRNGNLLVPEQWKNIHKKTSISIKEVCETK